MISFKDELTNPLVPQRTSRRGHFLRGGEATNGYRVSKSLPRPYFFQFDVHMNEF